VLRSECTKIRAEDPVAKKTVRLGNRQVSGELVPFENREEPWCVYQCSDGTTLRVKLVVSEIVRVDGMYTGEGDPVYVVKSSNVISTEVPEALRKTNTRGPVQ
jgi:hypothetical protein